MREIKFRAWDKARKRWTNYSIADDLPRFYDKHTGCWKTDKEGERFILCQYTGLKNYNGKEIYEGDIVRSECFFGWIGVAKYLDKNQSFVFESIDKNYRGSRVSLGRTEQYVKILGNIYENPEMLEEMSNEN
jgi:uncharacterized phage protein (TIGR01671 family)